MANPGEITNDDIVPDAAPPAVDIMPPGINGMDKYASAQAPNRTRRAWFVGGSWGASFIAVVGLSIRGGDGAIAKAAVDGFTSYMMAVATMYLIGHTLDRGAYLDKIRSMLPGGQPGGPTP